jgi:GxxExxY protein
MDPNPVTAPKQIVEPQLSYSIVGSLYEVYNELGFGFLESIYARALELVLRERGHIVDREYPLHIRFRGQQIGFHRCDLIVDRRVIVEIKATEHITDAPKRQLRNYLSATSVELGILLHFGPKANYFRVLGPKRRNRLNSSQFD